MTPALRRILPAFLRDQSGQILPFATVMITVLLLMVGFVADIGRLLYTQRQLQAATDAAALAGAQALPDSSAVAAATSYSAVAGNANASSVLAGASMLTGYPQVVCLSTLTAEGMACSSPANGNAITVKQQVPVTLYFLRLLGKSSLTLGASATAAMSGATAAPYNVAIVVDTTGSMSDTDSDSNCSSTRIACALSGVQVLLHNLSPCASSSATCGTVTSNNVANPVDEVSLYTFPGVTSTSQAAYDYNCSSTNPTTSAYTEPTTTPIYQIVGFSSDYRTSDSASALNASSSIVKAAGGVSKCPGLKVVGGWGTYYAGVIYAAQAALVAEAQLNPGSQNVMIILSDGDASATNTPASGKTPAQNDLPHASTTSGTYVSTVNECHQAITAAAAATSAGTRVYTVAYGAASSGCSTDKVGITPCATMQNMASAPQYFFSDYTASAGSSSCISASQPTSGLSQIFTQIANTMTVSRLIPDGTT